MTIQTFAKQVTRTTRYKLNNGQYIPVAGFSVYSVPAADTASIVYEALSQGYRHINSATMYGNQKEAAQGMAQFLSDHKTVSRQDIWFTTSICDEDQGYDKTKQAVAHIAREVKPFLEYVDLVLVHSPMTSLEERTGTWKALTEIYHNPNNGILQVHTIGVSNSGKNHIEEILAMDGAVVTPAINQLELHPWLPRVQLREYLTRKELQLRHSHLSLRVENLDDPELVALEQKFAIPRIEILLKWSYLQGFVVLVKSANKARIRSNIEILPESHGTSDELQEGANLGKIDLEPEILDVLDKPNSHQVFTWSGKDPTEYDG